MQLTSYFIVKKIYYSVTFNFTNSILVAVTLIILKWNLNSKTIVSKIDVTNKQLFICDSPDNPNIKNRITLIIRSNREEKVSFKIEWEMHN